jgi:hypothetical protein
MWQELQAAAIINLKGQCHEIFDPRFFHQNIRLCMHDRRMIRTALAACKRNIYQKHICSRIVLPHH